MNAILELIEKLDNCNGEIELTKKEVITIRTALRIYDGVENALNEELGLNET